MKGKPVFILVLCLGLRLTAAIARVEAAPTGCSPIYQDAAWTISTCPTDPSITIGEIQGIDGGR